MGFFDEAGVDVSDLSDDPFGFKDAFWKVRLVKIEAPKVTNGGDKFGSKIVWVVEHPRFDNQFVSNPEKGMGNWLQLPPPVPLHDQLGWDKDSADAKRLFFNFSKLLEALGFSRDEMPKVGAEEMLNQACFAKVRVSQNEAGFWQFNVYAHKALDDESLDNRAESNGGQVKSADDIMKEELG